MAPRLCFLLAKFIGSTAIPSAHHVVLRQENTACKAAEAGIVESSITQPAAIQVLSATVTVIDADCKVDHHTLVLLLF